MSNCKNDVLRRSYYNIVTYIRTKLWPEPNRPAKALTNLLHTLILKMVIGVFGESGIKVGLLKEIRLWKTLSYLKIVSRLSQY